MLPRSTALLCEANTCVDHEWRDGVESRAEYDVSSVELDALYAVLRAERFDRLESRAVQDVHDRGGTVLELRAAGHTYRAADAGREFTSNRERFRAVREAVEAFRQRLLERSGAGPTGAR